MTAGMQDPRTLTDGALTFRIKQYLWEAIRRLTELEADEQTKDRYDELCNGLELAVDEIEAEFPNIWNT